jgi:hypothetical protein
MSAAATETIGWLEPAAGAGAAAASGLGGAAGAAAARGVGGAAGVSVARGVGGAAAGVAAARGAGGAAGAIATADVGGADGAGAAGAFGAAGALSAAEDPVATADDGGAATGEGDRFAGDASGVGAPAGSAAGTGDTGPAPCVPRISKIREGTTTPGSEGGGTLSGARGAGASLLDRTTTAPVCETETGSGVPGEGTVFGAPSVLSHDGLNPSANRSASSSHEGFIRSANRSASSGERPVFSGARFSVNCHLLGPTSITRMHIQQRRPRPAA